MTVIEKVICRISPVKFGYAFPLVLHNKNTEFKKIHQRKQEKIIAKKLGLSLQIKTPKKLHAAILVPRVFLGTTLVLSSHVTLQILIAQGGVARFSFSFLVNVDMLCTDLLVTTRLVYKIFKRKSIVLSSLEPNI